MTTATATPPTKPAHNTKKKGLYVPEPEANPLQTQRDGRLFAIDLLMAAETTSADKSCINPTADTWAYGAGDTWRPYRSGPQFAGLAPFFFRVFRDGTEEAQRGFIAILSDVLGDDGGKLHPSEFLEYERRGLNQDFGEPGSAAPFPKGVDKNGKVMKGYDYKTWSANQKRRKGR